MNILPEEMKEKVGGDDDSSSDEITSYQPPTKKFNESDTPPGTPLCKTLTSSFQSIPPDKCEFMLNGSKSGILEFQGTYSRSENKRGTCSPAAKRSTCSKIDSAIFNTLGMTESNVGWASSLETLVAVGSPRDFKYFNTIERATFFPDPSVGHTSQIQRRALFPSSSSESLVGLQPLDLSDCEMKPYSREMRTSDVCNVLINMNMCSPFPEPGHQIDDQFDFDVGGASPNISLETSDQKLGLLKMSSVKQELKVTDTSIPLLKEPTETSERTGQLSPEPTLGISKTPPQTMSSPSCDKHLRCSSPNIFSPEVKVHAIEPVKLIVENSLPLSPVAEENSLNVSYLELELDKTPKFASPITTPVEMEDCKLVAERKNDHGMNVQISLNFGLMEAENRTSSQALFDELLNAALTSEQETSISPSQRRKGFEILSYGNDEEVIPFEMDFDEICKSVRESENASSQFFYGNKIQLTTLPQTNEIVSFKNFANSVSVSIPASKLPVYPSTKRAIKDSETTLQCRTKKKDNLIPQSNSMDVAPCEVQKGRIKLEVSPWSSKERYLVDSQAEVSDTQIFRAVDEVEKSMLAVEFHRPQKRTKSHIKDDRTGKKIRRIYKPETQVEGNEIVMKNDCKHPSEFISFALSTGGDVIRVDSKCDLKVVGKYEDTNECNNLTKSINSNGPSKILPIGQGNENNYFEDLLKEELLSEEFVKKSISSPCVGLQVTENNKISESFNVSSGRVEPFSEENRKEEAGSIEDHNLKHIEHLEVFPGFRTANDTEVKSYPSVAALARSKKLFASSEDVDNEPYDIKLTVFDEKFPSFRTANNTEVKSNLSAAALRRAKNLFEESIAIVDMNKKNDVKQSILDKKFQGFITANNADIKCNISEAVLARARGLFEDSSKDVNEQYDNKQTVFDVKFPGFRTANNTEIKSRLSTATLARAKNLFEESIGDVDDYKKCEVKQTIPDKKFQGFRTANNAEVKCNLSAVALARAKKLFEESSTDVDVNEGIQTMLVEKFHGFRTANNNEVMSNLSEAAVARAKKLFEESSKEPSGVIYQKKCCVKQEFSGFQLNMSSSKAPCTRTKGIFEENSIAVFDSTKRNDDLSADNYVCEAWQMFDDVQKDTIQFDEGMACEAVNSSVNNTASVSLLKTFGKSEVDNFSDLDFSCSDLLEGTNWDDPMLPPWFHSSQPHFGGGNDEVPSISTVRAASKRTLTSSDTPVSKKPKLFDRQQARELQTRLAKNIKEVFPEQGSHFLRKTAEIQYKWQTLLPNGPQKLEMAELKLLGVRDFVLNITADNAQNFRFDAMSFFSLESYETNTSGLTVGDNFLLILDDEHRAGAQEMERAFLAGPGVAAELVPHGWVTHHYGMLVWKLACYECSCPRQLAGRALTPHNLMLQLKYRYDREVDRSQSSAIKRILERNDPAGRPLVLTIMRVTKLMEGHELLVTDGWYTCPARTDLALAGAIEKGKLRVGTKIMTLGAELVGCEEGIPPLERPAGVYLKLSTNSTRRVQWYRKLGFERLPCPPPVPLKSVLPSGGAVYCLRVVIVRVYPLLYREKTSEGKYVTRNARAEERAVWSFQREQEAQLEKLYSEIQKEIAVKNEKKPRRRIPDVTAKAIEAMSEPEELYHYLECAFDPASAEALLSEGQKEAMRMYQESLRVSACQELEQKIQSAKVQQRNVSSVLRVRVLDLNNGEESALLSWWQPDDELLSLFSEGKAFAVFNVNAGNSRIQGELCLNSTRQTRVEPLPLPQRALLGRKVLRPTEVTSNLTPKWGELDVVGLVVYIHKTEGAPLRTVYLTDTGQGFFGLIFWRGLQEFGCEDIVAEGLVIAASNVKWRSSSANAAIPCGVVTDTTHFAHNAKSPVIQMALDELKDELDEEDIPAMIERCQDSIISILCRHTFKNPTNLSMSTSAHLSFGANTSCGASSPARNQSPHFRPRYLNGVEARPRAASTPVKQQTPLQKRLEKLQQYGELPLPSPVLTISSRPRRQFTRRLKLTTSTCSPPMEL